MKNLVQTAIAEGNFKTLIRVIQETGLVDILSVEGPFTIFAPTDQAFAKLPKGTMEKLLKDKEKLTEILTYHVISDYIDEFKQLNTRIIGISPDSSDSHKKFERKHNLTFNLLSDPNHDVLKSYDVWKPKKLYGREFMGVIRSTFLIDPNGRIVHIWPKVKVMGHAQNVMNKLKEFKK